MTDVSSLQQISRRQRPSEPSRLVPDRGKPHGGGDLERAPRFSHYLKRPLQRLMPAAFALVVSGALMLGWLGREEQHFSPEEGVGYWLGIAGSILMLMLLLYPIRKRLRALRHLGGVAGWFRAHMLFGVVGPTLILFHANFALHSLNATIATAAMLIVVASGFVGRYLHARIHMGLYGQRAALQELLADVAALKAVVNADVAWNEAFSHELSMLESYFPTPGDGETATIWSFVRSRAQSRRSARRLSRLADHSLRLEAKKWGWTRRMRRDRMALVRTHLTMLRAAMLKTATYTFYARLFSLWHHLHLPLFVVLILAAILHVVAVHLY